MRQVAGVGKPRPYPGLGAVRQVAGVGKPRPYPGLGAVRQVRAWASLRHPDVRGKRMISM